MSDYDLYWPVTALLAGLIVYELVFTNPENVDNAIAIAKDPAIRPERKMPRYFEDKKLIDLWKKIYPEEHIPGPFIRYVANNSPAFTGE